MEELEPETIMPCQIGDRRFETSRLQPEKRLQLAVLQDAILTFNRLVPRDGHRPARRFAEVESWFASEDTHGPFTFVTICDGLNLDPDYIRGGLRRWRARIDGAETRRPPFRRAAIGTRHRVVLSRPLRRIA